MDRQNLFDVLAKDASKPDDRGTVLTRWVVCKKGVGVYQRVCSWWTDRRNRLREHY